MRSVNDARMKSVYSNHEISLNERTPIDIDGLIEELNIIKDEGFTNITFWGETDYDTDEIYGISAGGLLSRPETPQEIEVRLDRDKQNKLEAQIRERANYERLRKIYGESVMDSYGKKVDKS